MVSLKTKELPGYAESRRDGTLRGIETSPMTIVRVSGKTVALAGSFPGFSQAAIKAQLDAVGFDVEIMQIAMEQTGWPSAATEFGAKPRACTMNLATAIVNLPPTAKIDLDSTCRFGGEAASEPCRLVFERSGTSSGRVRVLLDNDAGRFLPGQSLEVMID